MRVSRADWYKVDEWSDIYSGDDWLLAYLPLDEEPPRCGGESITHPGCKNQSLRTLLCELYMLDHL